jgi:MtfA peptidase
VAAQRPRPHASCRIHTRVREAWRLKVLARWQRAWQERRNERTLRRRAIPDALWQLTLARYPFIARRPEAERTELRRLATLFLDRKEFSGAGGMRIDDEVAVAVAAQACLPVLRLGLERYDGFVGIVIQPDEVVTQRVVIDDDGVVHEYNETLTGEAMHGGPVMLAWPDVEGAGESSAWAYNVVIHEFAHVLDMDASACAGTLSSSTLLASVPTWMRAWRP